MTQVRKVRQIKHVEIVCRHCAQARSARATMKWSKRKNIKGDVRKIKRRRFNLPYASPFKVKEVGLTRRCDMNYVLSKDAWKQWAQTSLT